MKAFLLLAPALALAACARPAPAPEGGNSMTSLGGSEPAAENRTAPSAPAASPLPAPSKAAPTQTKYLGRWTGVEGMYLLVSERPGGGVTMEMQYDLDHRGTFPASVTAKGLRFTRNGVVEIAVPTDGDATGLKWLAGKKDCLTVKPGEGYCRG